MRFKRLVVVTVLLLILLYGALILISRTQGFKAIVEKRISSILEIPVTIERVKLDLSLNFSAERLKSSKAGRKGEPGLSAERVVCDISLSHFIKNGSLVESVAIHTGRLYLAQTAEGWAPAVVGEPAAELSPWLGIQMLDLPGAEPEKEKTVADQEPVKSRLPAGDAVAISVRNGSVVWWGPDRESAARAEGIDVLKTPLTTPVNRLRHWFVTIRHLETARSTMRQLSMEVLEQQGGAVLLGLSIEREIVNKHEQSLEKR